MKSRVVLPLAVVISATGSFGCQVVLPSATTTASALPSSNTKSSSRRQLLGDSRVDTALSFTREAQGPESVTYATVDQVRDSVELANSAIVQAATAEAISVRAASQAASADLEAKNALTAAAAAGITADSSLLAANAAQAGITALATAAAATEAKANTALAQAVLASTLAQQGLERASASGDAAAEAAAAAALADTNAQLAALRAAAAEAAAGAATLRSQEALAQSSQALATAQVAADRTTGVESALAVMRQNSGELNVRDFGAKGDGTTDDSAAFIAAIAKAESLATTTSGALTSNFRGMTSIFIPPGEYLITQGEALMRGSYTKRTAGLEIVGAGRGVSRLVFRPVVEGATLMKAQDSWLHVKISGLEVNSSNASANFMHSVSAGGTQNLVFEDINWTGRWNNVFLLTGENNNSEITWRHCGFYDSIAKGVYVPAGMGSDQFVNFNFYDTQYEVASGDYLVFERGGNINIWGGSLIHTAPAGGTFFKLLGNTHAYGTQRFLCIGARIEHRNPGSVLVDSKWNGGTVSFINIDASSSAHILPPDSITAKFSSINSTMPNTLFQNCSLIGKHQYSSSISSWESPHNVTYAQCDFPLASGPKDVVNFSDTVNVGGRPAINFIGCRGTAGSGTIWDTTLNFGTAVVGTSTKKVISVKGPAGRFPTSGQKYVVTLPPNSIITRVDIFSPAGSVTSAAAADFKLQTSETVPSILASVFKTPHSSGFSVTQSMNFVCNSASRCELNLIAGPAVDQANAGAYCLIEYI